MRAISSRSWTANCQRAANRHRGVLLLAVFSAASLSASLSAADRAATVNKVESPTAAVVELFAGIEAGEVTARFIPRDDRQANVILTNRTGRPLSIRLPDAFAGVPVAAQFRQNKSKGITNASQQQPQTLGSGFPGGGSQNRGGNPFGNNNNNNNNNQFNQRQGNGIFNIPAEKTIQFKVAAVCLEHGKPKPRATIAYEMRPLDSVSEKPELRALLVSLAAGKTSQTIAQAVAWHLASGLSWEQLAAKRVDHISGPVEPYFSAKQLRQAKELCAELEKTTQEVAGERLVAASAAGPVAK